jgi:hypothetical protein
VIIAVDDLDKQDPATVKQLLLNAQGMLKSGAWFILTGHPSGLTRDILKSASHGSGRGENSGTFSPKIR